MLDRGKMVVVVVADREPAMPLLRSFGFDPGVRLRDRSGSLRDLILARSVGEQWSSMVVACEL